MKVYEEDWRDVILIDEVGSLACACLYSYIYYMDVYLSVTGY